MKVQVFSDGIMKQPHFNKYTNVRRHHLDTLNEEQLGYVFENLPPNLLIFTLTDPALEQIANGFLENECKYLFEQFYA